jgi:hypothetical protein
VGAVSEVFPAEFIIPDGLRGALQQWAGGITQAVRNAPLFSDVVADVLARLDGTVVVAHSAVFEERFILAELARAGIKTPPMPVLCSLWLGGKPMTHQTTSSARSPGTQEEGRHSLFHGVLAGCEDS